MARGPQAGYALLLVLVLVGTITFAALGVTALGRHDVRAARASAGDAVVRMLAELGAWEALDLLEIAPAWRTTGRRPWQGNLDVGGTVGTYEVTVEEAGGTVDGAPRVRVVSRGRYGDRAATVAATVHVVPPAFFRAALSLFGGYDNEGRLEAEGDVYVSGPFRHRGEDCEVEGDLVVESIQGDGSRGRERGRGRGRGRGQGDDEDPCEIGGDLLLLQEQPSAYRNRPVPPLAWYRWAERRLWQGLYGRSEVPRPRSFQEMLDLAADPAHPFGALFVVPGDFVLGDQGRVGGRREDECRGVRGWEVRGKLTVVVEGVLTVCPKSIRFPPGDTESRFAAISLTRMEFQPAGPGSVVGLYYAYDPHRMGEGSIGLPTPDRGRYAVRGTLAGAYLTNRRSYIEVQEDPERLVRGAAPGLPGMRAVIHEWVVGTEGSAVDARWGLD